MAKRSSMWMRVGLSLLGIMIVLWLAGVGAREPSQDASAVANQFLQAVSQDDSRVPSSFALRASAGKDGRGLPQVAGNRRHLRRYEILGDSPGPGEGKHADYPGQAVAGRKEMRG